MKKAINLLIGLIISIPMFAQTSYFYSKGQRIPVILDPTRVSVLISKTSNLNVTQRVPANTTVVKTCVSHLFNFSVIENVNYGATLLNYMQSSVGTTNNIVLPCYKDTDGEPLILSERIDVKLQNLAQVSMLYSAVNSLKLRLVGQDPYMPLWYMVEITPQTGMNTIEVARQLYEIGHFAEAYPNFHIDSDEISWDENVLDQWGLYNYEKDIVDINASSAWNIATGKGIKVAILDGGIDLTNDDLKDNIHPISCCAESIDTCNFTFRPSELNLSWNSSIGSHYSHGTCVASIVAAVRNNGIQLAGVAPDAKLISISQNSSNGKALGINWAWKNGADIINCSWKDSKENPKIVEAIDSALIRGRNGKGCIVVKSAGNSYDEITFPGKSRENILVVGAIDNNGYRAEFSSYGNCLDVVAPGKGIRVITNGNRIIFSDGTSYAAPHVAGVAALILERNPDLTGHQVRDIIEQNTTKVGNLEYEIVEDRPNGTWNEEYGYGLIDAYKALLATPKKQEQY